VTLVTPIYFRVNYNTLTASEACVIKTKRGYKIVKKDAKGTEVPVIEDSFDKTSAVKTYKKYLSQTQKRDGRVVPFAFGKIVTAVDKALQ